MGVVGNVIARVGADTRPFQQGLRNAQRNLSSFQNGVNTSLNKIKIMQAAIVATLGLGIREISNNAMNYEASLQRIAFMFGNNATDINKWADNNAAAFNVSRLEATQYAAVYGNLLMTFAKDTKQLTDYTTQLLEASAIVASATGRDMQDVMERMRSGLLGNTEAIEDLGVSIFVNMIEGTKAFQRFSNGQAWKNLSFQTQQQIRLFAILEQVNEKFGTSLYQNTKTKLGVFTSTIKNAALNIGIGLLPVINAMLPALTNMAIGFERITQTFANFMQLIFGYKLQQTQNNITTKKAATAQDALGNSVKKAGKKVSDGLQGFDELNILQKEIADGADDVSDAVGGGVNTVDTSGVAPNINMPTLETNPLFQAFEGIKQKAQEIFNLFNTNFGESFKLSFDKIKDSVIGLGKSFYNLVNLEWLILKGSVLDYLKTESFSKNIDLLKQSIINLGDSISGSYNGFKKIIDIISNVVSDNFDNLKNSLVKLWVGIGDVIGAFVYLSTSIPKNAVDLFNQMINRSSDLLKNVYKTSIELVIDVIKGLGSIFTTTADGMVKVYDDNIAPMKELFMDVWGTISDLLNSLVVNVINPVLLPAFNAIAETVDAIMPEVWANISETFTNIIGIMSSFWNETMKPITDWISNTLLPLIRPVFVEIGLIFKDVFTSAMGLVEDVTKALKGLSEFLLGIFTDDWGKAWNGVKTIVKSVFESLVNLVRIPLNGMIRLLNNFLSSLSNIKINIPSVDILGKKFGGMSIGFPSIQLAEIPVLDSGGIISSPTIAQLSANSKPEAIVPLENTSFVTTIADAIANSITEAMYNKNNSSQSNSEFVLNIDGQEIARILHPKLEYEGRRQGSAMISLA